MLGLPVFSLKHRVLSLYCGVGVNVARLHLFRITPDSRDRLLLPVIGSLATEVGFYQGQPICLPKFSQYAGTILGDIVNSGI